ncbi:protein O-linked-mannose beta-1,2-N-acetylglucosaminyltransferase 1-like isoform X2 [Scylla paramamosain]|uniref:protein O-linked-mannose beta-1,2-N-acetylglucosaminyltransferase 1-like isoform X2 n=1 Tax=Scylla paramamosain TaxID=85552 RepID=UPI003083D682
MVWAGTLAVVLMVVVVVVRGELSVKWRNIGRDRQFRPFDLETYERIQAAKERHIHLTLQLVDTHVQLFINDVLEYESKGKRPSRLTPGSTHSGVHVLVVHESHGHLMMAQHFVTHQPAEHQRLRQCMATVQRGRVVVLLGAPEWVMFLSQEAEGALTALGSKWASRVAQGETWAWVGVLGGATLGEAVTTRRLEQYPACDLRLDVFVAKTRESGSRCAWYDVPGMQRQATFCEQYEGYSDLCACEQPFFPETRKLQKTITMREKIPVVVVTATKPYYLYRLLRQLFTQAGAWQTDVLLVVDGAHQETLSLAGVLGVASLVHRPESFKRNRTNANIRFALQSVFRLFPAADKAILLEDDLLLSPDFLRFFHQVAPLLDRDPTVSCINAFNSNSFPDTARDPRVLLRARSYPMYGWLTSRAYAAEITRNWVPEGTGDWDLWLTRESLRKGRDVVSPEVSRTFHAGSSGVHVNGFEQELYFNRMIYNRDPEVTVEEVELTVRAKYDELLHRDLKTAQSLIPPSRDLCNMTWVPRNSPRPLAIYIYAEDSTDKYHTYEIFLMCFRTYDISTREMYRGVMRLRWGHAVVFLVGCPYSPFCVYSPEDTVYLPTVAELQRAAAFRDDWEMTQVTNNPRVARDSSRNPDLELTNVLKSGRTQRSRRPA